MMKLWNRGRAGDLAAAAGTAHRRGAFTLLEVIIAVGAVAVVSVGLAAIFQTIGRTVTQGQKVSALTQYAATLEQQMRRDFASMSREGFLVIRNQFAGVPNGANLEVKINKDDPSPRFRRVDEILFFTKGEYQTGRSPINPEMIARGDTAMVYYGHGLLPAHRDDDGDGIPNPQDVRPSVSSLNAPDPGGQQVPGGRGDLYLYGGGGYLGQTLGGFALPNTYAADWTLLRKRTILAKPKSTREMYPWRGWPSALRGEAGNQAVRTRLTDNSVQVASQPAASSIFRSLARVFSVTPPGVLPRNGVLVRPTQGAALGNFAAPADPGSAFPQLSSGLVDIATTDLDEVRTIVQTFQPNPWDGNLLSAYDSLQYTDPSNPANVNWDAKFRQQDLDRMHAWMEDAFPTQSDRFGRQSDPTDPVGARVRYETAPPDYLNILTDLQGNANPEAALALIVRRGDQAMIAEGAVLPRCTEFKVEWSFGEATALAQQPSVLQWYGSTTDFDFNFTQYTQARNPHLPFANRPNAQAQKIASHTVRGQLIYGSVVPPPSQTQTAHFGYFDPFYTPATGGNVDPTKPMTAPWAWPKLVRITVAMVDERDPLKEEKFQWVFELPGTPDPQ